ncbi:MAG: hypothetical protein IPM29_07815 [Planctomycetes bacterium]|nr:hypothetical protein [Planctomycetota bacterium]
MPLPRPALLATATCLLAGVTAAQTLVTLPIEYERAWGRGSSSLLGGSSTRTQMIFAQPFQLGTAVSGVGFRPTAATADRAGFTVDIEIQMSSTANAPGALSSTFASNVGSDVVVSLPRQVVNVPAMPANRGTGLFATFPFAQPFLFGTNGNPNINVDAFVYGRSAGASWSTDRAFAAVSGRVATAGVGCGTATVNSTSVGGTYVVGSTVTLSIANAPASSPALLVPSVDMSEFLPGLPLPFDLARIGGGAGCELLVNPALGGIPLMTDATGAASLALTVPPGVARVGTGWQWIYVVPAGPGNPLGLETTANRAIWFGPEVVVPGAQYVWDLSNVNATTGNSTTDSCPIVQFRL